MIIYKAENKKTGKIYIGQTIQSLRIRINHHVCVGKSYFDKALKKYGRDAFSFGIIDTASCREELNQKERYWIGMFNSIAPNGYNLTTGGEGGFERSPLTISKMRIAAKKRLESEEFRKKLSESQKGRVVSEETRQKISNSLKGKPSPTKGKKATNPNWIMGLTKETDPRVMALAEKMRGKKRPDFAAVLAGLPKREGYVNPMKGKKRPDLAERNRMGKGKRMSDESRAKLSEALRNNPKVHAACEKARAVRLNRLKNQKEES